MSQWGDNIQTLRVFTVLKTTYPQLPAVRENWQHQPITIIFGAACHSCTSNKNLSYRRGTARRAMTVKTVLNVEQMFVELHLISPVLGQ